MKFSVIIPVYNVVDELPRAIESLKSQSLSDYEIVLVDDGSTDGSGELIDSYASIATVLHQENQGVVVARHNGFKASRGEWILFVDGDDAIKPNTLISVKAEIDRANGCMDMVCFGFDMVFPHRRRPCRLPLVGTFSTRELIDRMKITPLEFISSCIGNKCCRREIVAAAFEDVGDAKITYHEDTLFAAAMFLETRTIRMLSDCFYEYTQRNNSVSRRFNDNAIEEEQQFVLSLWKLIGESGRFSVEQMTKCMSKYRDALPFRVFGLFISDRVEYDAGLRVLRKLNATECFLRFCQQCGSPRLKVIRFLLSHPMVYCRIAPVLYCANVIRKKSVDWWYNIEDAVKQNK